MNRSPSSDAAAAIVNLIDAEKRKPARVLARLVADHLDALGFLAVEEEPEEEPRGLLVLAGKRPDPPTWLRFATTLDDTEPVAVTRNRTEQAIEHLGLEPSEVRAVVIEHDWLRVYRWTDRTTAQTLPVLEEPA